MDDDMKIGKKIVLRPITNNYMPLVNKPDFVGSNKKRIAQQIYYAKNPLRSTNGPVHTRLGYKRNNWYNYMGPHFFVKPRIRKGADGLMTARYAQKAQQRLKNLQKRWKYAAENPYPLSLQVSFANKNGHRFPNFIHSLKNSLTAEIQEQLKLFKEQTVDPQVIDDIPMPSEDQTSLTLHERFSTYP